MASVLEHSVDRFNVVSVNIEPSTLLSAVEVAERLSLSLSIWREKKHRGAWLSIPESKSELIAAAVASGFTFHHVDMHTRALILSLWLSEDEKNVLPHYASTYLGAGGLVVNERGEVIVIMDKYSRLPNFWKLPGGAVDVDEDISSAVVREVKEEVGIDAEFVSLLSFRQLHQFRWGCGDLYFVCLLRVANSSQALSIQPEEILGARWLPLEDALALPSLKHTTANGELDDVIRQEVARLLAHWPSSSSLSSSSVAVAPVESTDQTRTSNQIDSKVDDCEDGRPRSDMSSGSEKTFSAGLVEIRVPHVLNPKLSVSMYVASAASALSSASSNSKL